MPLVLALIGIILIVVAVRGTQAQAAALLKDEFTGQDNFIRWAMAIAVLGGLGYVKPIAPIMRAMIGLVILGMIFANEGFFAKFNEAIQQGGESPGTVGGASNTGGGSILGVNPTPEQMNTPIPLNGATGSLASPLAPMQRPGQTYTGSDGKPCTAPSYLAQLFGMGCR